MRWALRGNNGGGSCLGINSQYSLAIGDNNIAGLLKGDAKRNTEDSAVADKPLFPGQAIDPENPKATGV